jgi:16S rRNA (guanine527-N7)-methyltransferase
VKHRSGVPAEPAQIGNAVRTLVEAFLHATSNHLPADFPNRIEKFAASIALWGLKNNLTAHPEDPEELAFHVIDCLMPIILAGDTKSPLVDQFVEGARILDLGSGAGFPGLVLAAASRGNFTLVESRRKRASFLQFVTAEMGLMNVVVEMQRAEGIDFAQPYDLVTARAFGDTAEFFALADRALKSGGLAMLYANPSQHFGPEVQRVPYQVARRGERIDRILALRKRT